MPKNKLQEVIFSLLMVLAMVYAMVCYNIALAQGGLHNAVFLLALRELPIMAPVALALEVLVVGRLARRMAAPGLRGTRPADPGNPGRFLHDRMPDVSADEPVFRGAVPASRRAAPRRMAAERRAELPHGSVLAALFRRPRRALCVPAAVLPAACRACARTEHGVFVALSAAKAVVHPQKSTTAF